MPRHPRRNKPAKPIEPEDFDGEKIRMVRLFSQSGDEVGQPRFYLAKHHPPMAFDNWCRQNKGFMLTDDFVLARGGKARGGFELTPPGTPLEKPRRAAPRRKELKGW